MPEGASLPCRAEHQLCVRCKGTDRRPVCCAAQVVNGHVDNLACFIRPGVVALSWCDDINDPQARPRGASAATHCLPPSYGPALVGV